MTIQLSIRKAGLVGLFLLFGCLPYLRAQEGADEVLKVARKQEKMAKGLKGEDAERVLSKALAIYERLDSKFPEAVAERAVAALRKGQLLKKLGRQEEALASFRATLSFADQQRTQADALLAAAAILRKQKKATEAGQSLQEILARCTNEKKRCAQAMLRLASLCRQQKDYRGALDWAAQVLDKHPTLWRENVDAGQTKLAVLLKCRQWQRATKELAEFDIFMAKRFKASESWSSVQKALASMSARKNLTPIPIP